ncbi:MAG: hypothetical protein AVDCRST_MAG49-3501, partial [uncultured Thermomicrobiales bacterium]
EGPHAPPPGAFGGADVAGPPRRPRRPRQPRRLAPHRRGHPLHLQPRGLPAHPAGVRPVAVGPGGAGLLGAPVGGGRPLRGRDPRRPRRRRAPGRHRRPPRAADPRLARPRLAGRLRRGARGELPLRDARVVAGAAGARVV